jgi:hypothetical protein
MRNAAKTIATLWLPLLSLTGCHRLSTIEDSSQVSPEAFLQNQPWLNLSIGDFSFVWSQPSSSLMVFFVALYTIFKGYKFLSHTQQQRAKFWWGIGLLLTGIGAFLAGISYQALGYEIKCNGREICTFTSEWEVAYMLLSIMGLAALVIAASFSNAKGKVRKVMIVSALVGLIVYSSLLFYGIFGAIKLLVSFEFMAAFSSAVVIFFILLHSRAWIRERDSMNRSLLTCWIIFVAVFLIYGIYLNSGLTSTLWAKGIWFTENDVLHLGMVYWVYFVGKHLPERLKDLPG